MKKILSLIGSLGLIVSSGVNSVVSCKLLGFGEDDSDNSNKDKLIELKIKDIEENPDVKKITNENLDNLSTVNEALSNISITGVSSMNAVLKSGSLTDVTVTVTVAHGYTIDRNTFDITGAIKKGDIQLKIKDIEENPAVKAIKDLEDLKAVNKALSKISITGVSLMIAVFVSGTANVSVTVSLEPGYTIDRNTFVIDGAVKLRNFKKTGKGEDNEFYIEVSKSNDNPVKKQVYLKDEETGKGVTSGISTKLVDCTKNNCPQYALKNVSGNGDYIEFISSTLNASGGYTIIDVFKDGYNPLRIKMTLID